MDEKSGKWSELDWLNSNDPARGPIKPSSRRPDPPIHAGAPSELRFTYKPKVPMLIVAAIFFALCGWFIQNEAATNDRGLTLEGFIRFSTHGATLFYQVLAVVSFVFVGFAIFAMFMSYFTHREIVLDKTSITFPGYLFSPWVHRIEFADIQKISTLSIKRNKFIKIYHAGRSHSFGVGMLPGEGDADTILNWIAYYTPNLQNPTAPRR